MKNIEIIMSLRGACNYSCYYCVGDNTKHVPITVPLDHIEKICHDLEGVFTVTSFECGASEPTLHSQIKDLIRIFLKKGAVSIPTNNSTEPESWLLPNSKGVLIRAALHPQGEKDIEGFTEHLLNAKVLGAEVRVEFVAHPKRMLDIDRHIDFFAKHEIQMAVSGFIGTYEGKRYPEAYTPEEKMKIGLVHNTWYERLNLDIPDRNFFGIPCLAGHSLIYIDPYGRIKRCLYDQEEIFGIQEILPCKVPNCGCGLYLEKLNNQDVGFWNYWRSIAGIPLMGAGVLKTEDELYEEKKDAYRTLRNL